METGLETTLILSWQHSRRVRLCGLKGVVNRFSRLEVCFPPNSCSKPREPTSTVSKIDKRVAFHQGSLIFSSRVLAPHLLEPLTIRITKLVKSAQEGNTQVAWLLEDRMGSSNPSVAHIYEADIELPPRVRSLSLEIGRGIFTVHFAEAPDECPPVKLLKLNKQYVPWRLLPPLALREDVPLVSCCVYVIAKSLFAQQFVGGAWMSHFIKAVASIAKELFPTIPKIRGRLWQFFDLEGFRALARTFEQLYAVLETKYRSAVHNVAFADEAEKLAVQIFWDVIAAEHLPLRAVLQAIDSLQFESEGNTEHPNCMGRQRCHLCIQRLEQIIFSYFKRFTTLENEKSLALLKKLPVIPKLDRDIGSLILQNGKVDIEFENMTIRLTGRSTWELVAFLDTSSALSIKQVGLGTDLDETYQNLETVYQRILAQKQGSVSQFWSVPSPHLTKAAKISKHQGRLVPYVKPLFDIGEISGVLSETDRILFLEVRDSKFETKPHILVQPGTKLNQNRKSKHLRFRNPYLQLITKNIFPSCYYTSDVVYRERIVKVLRSENPKILKIPSLMHTNPNTFLESSRTVLLEHHHIMLSDFSKLEVFANDNAAQQDVSRKISITEAGGPVYDATKITRVLQRSSPQSAVVLTWRTVNSDPSTCVDHDLGLNLLLVGQESAPTLLSLPPIDEFPVLDIVGSMFDAHRSEFTRIESRNGNHVCNPDVCLRQNLQVSLLANTNRTSHRLLVLAANRYSPQYSSVGPCSVAVWELPLEYDSGHSVQKTSTSWTFRGWHEPFRAQIQRGLSRATERCVVLSEPWQDPKGRHILSVACVGNLDQIMPPPVYLLHGIMRF